MHFRNHSLKWRINIISRWLLFPYIFVVLWLTLFNREARNIRYELTPFWEYKELLSGNIGWLHDILGNILLFIPLGFLLPTIFNRFRTLKATFISGALFSISIELLQLITARGLCEFDDVFNNSLGAVIGYGLYHHIQSIMKKRR